MYDTKIVVVRSFCVIMIRSDEHASENITDGRVVVKASVISKTPLVRMAYLPVTSMTDDSPLSTGL